MKFLLAFDITYLSSMEDFKNQLRIFPVATLKPQAITSSLCTFILSTMTISQFFFISILSIIISTSNFTHVYSHHCLHDQKALLLELKNDLIFDPYYSKRLVQWNQTDDCCSWDGVGCDDVGRVISLQLDNEAISGGIDGNSSSLFSLRCLKKLNLALNYFTGAQIPTGIGNLAYLTQLDLSSAGFVGEVPVELSRLSRLVSLDLSGNSLNGSLSSVHFEGLSNLVYLNLEYNSFSDSIPQSVFGLNSLESLVLNDNQFNGTFQLEKIQRFRNLSYLGLSHNNLSVDTSNINSSFPILAQLVWLGLASCNLHSFPDLRNQSNLHYLDLANNSIAGEIPNWIWGLGNGKLGYLNLSSNLLVDLQKPYHIPTSLWILDLHSNLLQGELFSPILYDIININSSLFLISFENNNLSGLISKSLCNATWLEVLDLSNNKLSGNIPPCLIENNTSLQVLNLGRNNITGDIPDKFSVDCSLGTLDLSNNNLGGNLPKSLGNCKRLEALNVGNNNINDSFPCMLPPSLRLLVLRSNRFHGDMTCHRSWPDLQIIDIASNNFSGYLNPISFSNWKGMTPDSHAPLMRKALGFGFGITGRNYYQYEVTLTIKGLERRLVKIWRDFASIDFSCNNFHGTIPDAIGDLISLYLLNLSHNALTGPIPKSFEKLRQLGSLDLSVNQLTGVIPTELAGLSFLSVLNLSHNKLVGMIPKGTQFQSFPANSFQENKGLCGLPLSISCNNNDENDSSSSIHRNVQSHGKMEIEWGYVSSALGYVVGLGSFLWTLICCQSLRERYFEKVDEVLDKIFGL